VDLELGPDRELLVRPVMTNWIKTEIVFDAAGNISGWTTKESWAMELQNSKDIDATLDLRRNFSGDWSITTGTPYEKVDANKVKFIFPLAAQEKKKFFYDVTVRHGTSATR